MVTQAQYKNIEHSAIKVISALSHGAIRGLCDKKVVQLGMFDEKNIVEVVDGNLRYCLCKNPEMAAKERETRKALLTKTTAELDKIVACERKTKYSKEMRAGKIVNKYNMGKFVIFQGAGDELSYSVDQEKVDEEASLDGCYIVYTDVPSDDMTAIETVKSYKSLIRVEQAFRSMKTIRLEMRPIYHKTDERIKCHVFICMLAYYIMWYMKQRLQPLFDADGAGRKRYYSFDNIMKILESIRQETIEFLSAETTMTTTPTDEQIQILDLLGVTIRSMF